MGCLVLSVIKKDSDGLDVMLNGQSEVDICSLLEALGVLLPNHAVQKHSHGVEADANSAQLPVDTERIKVSRLPNFQLVNGPAMDEIGTRNPWVQMVAIGSFGQGPA